MPSESFPLFCLPDLPIINIFSQTGLDEILSLSMVSKVSAQVVCFSRIKVLPMTIEVAVTYDNAFTLELKRSQRIEKKTLLGVMADTPPDEELSPLTVRMNARHFDCRHHSRRPSAIMVHVNERERYEAVHSAWRHAMYLFRQHIGTLLFNAAGFSDHTIWEWLPREFPKIDIRGPIKRETVREFFAKCRATRCFRFRSGCPEIAKYYNRIRNLDKFSVLSAPWFTKHHMQSLKCRVFHANYTKLNNHDIRKIIRKWMSDESKDLVKMKISNNVNQFHPNVVLGRYWLRHLATLRKRNKRSADFYINNYRRYCELTRESDGAKMRLTVRRSQIKIVCEYPE